MTEQADGNVYEMLWDCEFCGSQKLLGKTHRFCPVCGAAQNPEWRYMPSDDEKVAVHDHVYVGADKICPACGTAGAGNAEFCGRCGSPFEGAETVKTQRSRTKAEGDRFETEDLTARQDHEQDILLGRAQAEDKPEAKGNRRLLYLVVGVAILVVIGILVVVFWKKEATVTVAEHRWEREIDIEELKAESGKGSCGSVPGDAYNIDRRTEQVDTRQEPDGEECHTVQRDQGDGTMREEQVCETKYRPVTVMGEVCYYTVNRWREARSVKAEGGLDDPVVWPNVDLSRSGDCVGCEREGDRDEQYLLILNTEDGDTYECPLDEPDWRATALGTAFTVKIGVVTGDADCDTLERAE